MSKNSRIVNLMNMSFGEMAIQGMDTASIEITPETKSTAVLSSSDPYLLDPVKNFLEDEGYKVGHVLSVSGVFQMKVSEQSNS